MKDEEINSQVQNLTTLQEVEDNKATGLRSSRVQADPYGLDAPTMVLDREYLIADWSVADNDTKFIWPQQRLAENVTISNYLKMYRLFRADTVVRIEVVTNPMQFGILEVSVIPWDDGSYSSAQALTQANWLLLDLSEQQSGELLLPYIRPQSYWATDEDNGDLRVALKAHIDTVTTTTATTIGIKVFAHYTNTEVAMPVYQWGELQSTGSIRRTAAVLGTTLLMGAAQHYLGQTGPDIVHSVLNEYETKKQEETHVNAKLELLGDVSTPGARDSSIKRLGDQVPRTMDLGSTAMDIYDLVSICKIPNYLDSGYLSNALPSFALHPSPFLVERSYPEVISKMFRYWRGAYKIYLRFSTSSMVSARLAIMLYPEGSSTASIAPLGDIPSWIVSIKGGLDWCLEVPYLQRVTWSHTRQPLEYEPVIRFKLLDLLPQPFDKPVRIMYRAYCSMSDDLQFAGLQSQASPYAEGELQSIAARMSEPIKIGGSTPIRYMGFEGTVLDITSRYTDKDLPTVEDYNVFTNNYHYAEEEVGLDNYDFLTTLYRWFSGDVYLKITYLNGAVSGLIKATIKNSKTPQVGGKSERCGDSSVLTTQAIWPVVELRYPYMSENPMNGLGPWFEPMYPLHLPQFENISSMLIATADNFRFHWLMPPLDMEGTLQSFLPGSVFPEHSWNFTSGTTTAIHSYSDVGPYTGWVTMQLDVWLEKDVDAPIIATVRFEGTTAHHVVRRVYLVDGAYTFKGTVFLPPDGTLVPQVALERPMERAMHIYVTLSILGAGDTVFSLRADQEQPHQLISLDGNYVLPVTEYR